MEHAGPLIPPKENMVIVGNKRLYFVRGRLPLRVSRVNSHLYPRFSRACRTSVHSDYEIAATWDERLFLALGLAVGAFFAASFSSASEKVFHDLHPSKSMSACIQPHSRTLVSSHGKLTG